LASLPKTAKALADKSALHIALRNQTWEVKQRQWFILLSLRLLYSVDILGYCIIFIATKILRDFMK